MNRVHSLMLAFIVLAAMIAVSVSVPASSGAQQAQQEQSMTVDVGKWYDLPWARGEFKFRVYYSQDKPAIQVYNMTKRETVYLDWLIVNQSVAFVITLSTGEKPTYTCTPTSISTTSATLVFKLFTTVLKVVVEYEFKDVINTEIKLELIYSIGS